MSVIETAAPDAASPRPTPSVGGFSAAAALVLVGVATFMAALLSATTGRGFGIAFNLVYFIVTTYAVLRVHVRDRFTVVFGPPLIYAMSLFVAGFFDSQETGRTTKRVIENTFVNLSFGAPWLVGTTVLAIVIAIVRGRRATVRQHHH